MGPRTLRCCRIRIGSIDTTLARLVTGLFAGLFLGVGPRAIESGNQDPTRGGQPAPLVFRDRLTPHWFGDKGRFWYRNDLADERKEFVLVDPDRATRAPAFDHVTLAASLSRATGAQHAGDRLPFGTIEFVDGLGSVRFKVGDTTWSCDLASYRCAKTEASAALEASVAEPRERRRGGRRRDRETRRGAEPIGPVNAPDGGASASVRGHDVYLRRGDTAEVRLTDDGTEGHAWSGLEWSPDSRRLLAWKTESAEPRDVYLVRSSPPDGGRAELQTRGYALPGDPFRKHEPRLFDADSGTRIVLDVDRFEHERLRPRVHWYADGRRFAYEQVDRGHQRFRVIEIDAHTGAMRDLVDEKSDTFVWTMHVEGVDLRRANWLESTPEMILASERDGWRHLYRVDLESGATSQITAGAWVVRGIERIDEDARQIWFSASGVNPDQDPYFVHHYRIGFDGTGLVALTAGNGHHTVRYAPDRRYLIDSYSRVDQPPVHELRRTSDGSVVCPLEAADISALVASGWEPPEVFVAKGRDGKTDIWGLIERPKDLDPTKRYPVIEDIYAGPHGAHVPKTFRPRRRHAELTGRGFVVVKIDGMGTAHRSKAFHDVCWQNLKDAGFPDRILWMKAAAAKYPYLDLSRVGIYGTSAGGQNAAAALLFHPEFYQVAVANCGCHDNRLDKASWNEQWMGYPVGPQYSACSNIDNAARLQGKLFLIVGEMDTNVPPESTMRFADALIRAGKDFDLLVVPNAGHGAGGATRGYVTRRTHDFFVRHLSGVEPPDRNAK